MTISTVIPVYKQTERFLKNLSHNLQFLSETEIIIVNDDPETDLKSVLKNIGQVTLIENAKNLGFAGAVNVGFAHASGSHILLLNTDTILNDVNYQSALSHFDKNKQLFAVGFAQTETDGSLVGKNVVYFEKGFIQHKKALSQTFGPTAWAEGGSSIFSKELFNRLGGFDTLYSPFYWEDVDLSYRAWKCGYEVIFDPSVLVQHHHSGTIANHFSSKTIATTAYRNQLIFIWKNLTDQHLLNIHRPALAKHLVKSMIRGQFSYINGFFQAYNRYSDIMKSKQQQQQQYTLTDVEVLRILSTIS